MIAPSSGRTLDHSGAPHDTRSHRSRLQPDDPDYLRLKEQTQKRLSASLARLVRELRTSSKTHQQDALSAFVQRQTQILRDAYTASFAAGAQDYFGEVSATPNKWSARVSVDETRLRKALSFYAPSIAKMAQEALTAVNARSDVGLEDALADSIQLGLFGGFHAHIGARPTGGLGGHGEDFSIRDSLGRWAGSRAHGGQEHDAANIHEHLAAQHHGGNEEGGGPNSGAKERNAPYKGVRLDRKQVLDLVNGHVAQNNVNKRLDLRGADLHGVNLSHIDLSRTHLGGANLRGANLSHMYLVGANLSHADLREAKLSDTGLTHANLRGADLRGANFKHATLTGANFREANLEGVTIESAHANDANFYQANLRETTFRDMVGYGMKFHGADLTKAEFSDSRIARSVFHEATMDGARFNELHAASNYNMDFAGATLVGAHFEMPQIEGFNFAGADLEGAVFAPNQYGMRPQIGHTNFNDANLTNADLNAIFRRSTFIDANWQEADMKNASFHEMEIGGVTYTLSGEPIDQDGVIKLFGLPHFSARPTGALGGHGEDFSIHDTMGRFAGSRAHGGQQEHESQRGILEHLAAQRAEGSSGGAGRSVNAGAHRIQRSPEHMQAIREYITARQSYQQAQRELSPLRQAFNQAENEHRDMLRAHNQLGMRLHHEIAARLGAEATTESISTRIQHTPEWLASQQALLEHRNMVDHMFQTIHGPLMRLADLHTAMNQAAYHVAMASPGKHISTDHPTSTHYLSKILGVETMHAAEQKLWGMVGGGERGRLHYEAETPQAIKIHYEGPTHEISLTLSKATGGAIARGLYVKDIYLRSFDKNVNGGMHLIHTINDLRASGVVRITTIAGKAPREGADMNGYDTWAKLGATGKVNAETRGLAQQHFMAVKSRELATWRAAHPGETKYAEFKPYDTVQQIMDEPGGAAFWKAYGHEFVATMDLTPGGRTAQKIDKLMARLEARAQPAQAAAGESVVE